MPRTNYNDNSIFNVLYKDLSATLISDWTFKSLPPDNVLAAVIYDKLIMSHADKEYEIELVKSANGKDGLAYVKDYYDFFTASERLRLFEVINTMLQKEKAAAEALLISQLRRRATDLFPNADLDIHIPRSDNDIELDRIRQRYKDMSMMSAGNNIHYPIKTKYYYASNTFKL